MQTALILFSTDDCQEEGVGRCPMQVFLFPNKREAEEYVIKYNLQWAAPHFLTVQDLEES